MLQWYILRTTGDQPITAAVRRSAPSTFAITLRYRQFARLHIGSLSEASSGLLLLGAGQETAATSNLNYSAGQTYWYCTLYSRRDGGVFRASRRRHGVPAGLLVDKVAGAMENSDIFTQKGSKRAKQCNTVQVLVGDQCRVELGHGALEPQGFIGPKLIGLESHDARNPGLLCILHCTYSVQSSQIAGSTEYFTLRSKLSALS